MAELEKILPMITELDAAEREELLCTLWQMLSVKWPARIASQEYPSIVSTPGICGGAARLIRTRIPVWVLERMRLLGVSEIDILRSFPSLRATDLVQAWSYAASHRAEIEKEILENEED
ncbi:MAG: DUF433 domain-containing protein [Gemmataceae bacterium]